MVIKIVKHGVKNETLYYGTCTTCGCEFTANIKDANTVVGGFVKNLYIVVSCPECSFDVSCLKNKDTKCTG